VDPSFVDDAAGLRRAIEYYADQGWTDGLPVVPVTESYLAEFLAQAGRDPGEVLLDMPHLNRALTVRLAAINAALAGCRPEYFPVVLAAWETFGARGGPPPVVRVRDLGPGCLACTQNSLGHVPRLLARHPDADVHPVLGRLGLRHPEEPDRGASAIRVGCRAMILKYRLARPDHEDLVVVWSGIPTAVAVARGKPQRAVGCPCHRPEPAVVADEVGHRRAECPRAVQRDLP
jgi:hypothetical protein